MASIAKLAIQITTDTAAMVTGFRAAQTQVRKFASDTQSAGAGLAGLFAKGGAFGGGLVTAAAAARALSQGLRFAVNEASQLQDRMAELGMIDEEETFSAIWKEFSETIGTLAIPAVQALGKELKQAVAILDFFAGTSELRKELKAAEERAEAAKKAAAEQKKADEEAKKAMERLREEGERLKESLRTPAEIRDDEIKRLQGLLKAGVIDSETVRRAAAETAREYAEAAAKAAEIGKETEKANKIRELVKPNVAAVEQGTAAEFSSRQDALFAVKRNEEAARQQILELKKIATQQERQAQLQKLQIDETRRITEAVMSIPQPHKGRF